MSITKQLLVVTAAEAGTRMIRESAKPRGEPIVTYVGGDTDLTCGRCGVVLVKGTSEEVDLGDLCLRCPACGAVNDSRWCRRLNRVSRP
jgi:hypothetical protein